tara:strand:- start:264 stop:431 length:168 start_codon:yes stop_codon:yes gene_type:complete
LGPDLEIDLIKKGLDPKIFADLLQADQGVEGCCLKSLSCSAFGLALNHTGANDLI